MIQDWFMRGIALGIAGQLVVMIASWKHITWRIEHLGKRVDKHNDFGERLARVETRTETLSKALD